MAKSEKNPAQEQNQENITAQAQQDIEMEAQGEEISQEQKEAFELFRQQLENKFNELTEAAKKEKERADELGRKYLVLQADFDNYRRRTNETIAASKQEGRIDVISQLIKVLDGIDQALTMISDQNTIMGINMIYRQIEEIFSAYGVTEIEALGQQFDARYHDALERVENSGEISGTVLSVITKGYRIGERVLRPSSVRIAG